LWEGKKGKKTRKRLRRDSIPRAAWQRKRGRYPSSFSKQRKESEGGMATPLGGKEKIEREYEEKKQMYHV